jgi:leucyl/phenylalanyl-tRNA--protein transferase
MADHERRWSDTQNPTAELLLRAYANGIFPMVDGRTSEVQWFSPDPRAILPLDGFHVPRSLARVVRAARFEVRTDTRFEGVMRACAQPRPDREETWIDERLIGAYGELHLGGFAHSVEAWLGGALVGGLYGVHLGGAFFGESMFSRPEAGGTDASKVCLVHLVELLRARDFALLDTQFATRHLERFGCVEVRRAAYLDLLGDALQRDASWPASGPLVPAG